MVNGHSFLMSLFCLKLIFLEQIHFENTQRALRAFKEHCEGTERALREQSNSNQSTKEH